MAAHEWKIICVLQNKLSPGLSLCYLHQVRCIGVIDEASLFHVLLFVATLSWNGAAQLTEY